MTSTAAKHHLKPAGRRPTELRPLPTRVSQRTYERLERLRDLDGMTIQEQVRRGLDYYLDHVELSIALAASPALTESIKTLHDKPETKGTVPNKIIPNLLAKHAPRAVRPDAPKVVVK